MKKTISNKTFPYERALYGEDSIELLSCRFDGEEDGESALKECTNILIKDSYFNLRYPFWHDNNVYLDNIEMTDKCRAALWYTTNLTIKDSKMNGIKALRECSYISITNTCINSPEFGWKCHSIDINNVSLIGEYVFLMSSEMNFVNFSLKGKYSFQYVKNVKIDNSSLDTKDAFWHSENVTVRNSYIKGEYLAWYSNGLTLIDCVIEGTQPLCYCKNLTLVNCKMVNTDLAFEYSEVNATILGNIISIKNPLKGNIKVESADDIILTGDSKYKSKCKIEVINK